MSLSEDALYGGGEPQTVASLDEITPRPQPSIYEVGERILGEIADRDAETQRAAAERAREEREAAEARTLDAFYGALGERGRELLKLSQVNVAISPASTNALVLTPTLTADPDEEFVAWRLNVTVDRMVRDPSGPPEFVLDGTGVGRRVGANGLAQWIAVSVVETRKAALARVETRLREEAAVAEQRAREEERQARIDEARATQEAADAVIEAYRPHAAYIWPAGPDGEPVSLTFRKVEVFTTGEPGTDVPTGVAKTYYTLYTPGPPAPDVTGVVRFRAVVGDASPLVTVHGGCVVVTEHEARSVDELPHQLTKRIAVGVPGVEEYKLDEEIARAAYIYRPMRPSEHGTVTMPDMEHRPADPVRDQLVALQLALLEQPPSPPTS